MTTVQEVDQRFMRDFAASTRKLLRFMPLTEAEARFENEFCSLMLTGIFYGGRAFAAFDGDAFVSVNISKFQRKPKQNAWGRYLNCYYAYTPVPFRRQGHAKRLLEHVESVALADGQHRIKSLVASFYGFVLHRAAAHDFWGIEKAGELVIDTPLCRRDGTNRATFPAGKSPRNCRRITAEDAAPMTDAQLHAALTNPAGRFKVSPQAAAERLENSPKPCAP